MARAFVAVRPPEGVLAEVARATARARDEIGTARWTTSAQWHLTLQFLGNRADLDAVGAALGELAAPGGDVRLGGGGAFPSEERARILWLGVVEGAETLAGLAAAVGSLLAPLGHEPDDRPFHAHLTLARLARPADARGAVAALGPGPVGERWTVGEVVLYESVTRRDGAEYRAHARFPLATG
ncbi:MAG TPA: RNA 2',3'-cyclic phosphodiesterase [Acidimicrobiia bacterium]|nr:RNA 2',3'-cyclic phosphodiesterase [Acidimicrobiia bacterium]